MKAARKEAEALVRPVKITITIHAILAILEIIALIHDIQVFGLAMFSYYTIDSNILQMLVSACILYCLLKKKEVTIPVRLSAMHLICAVGLTITFLIAAFVLAPQEGFAYYFLQNVAPINHFLAPVLSVLSFLFLGLGNKLPKKAVFAPIAATLLYGGIALVLNAARVLDGPYFFRKVYETAPGTIVMWFGIIAVLCGVLSGIYYMIRRTDR